MKKEGPVATPAPFFMPALYAMLIGCCCRFDASWRSQDAEQDKPML